MATTYDESGGEHPLELCVQGDAMRSLGLDDYGVSPLLTRTK